MTFTFFDERFGDRYVITVEPNGDFHALRFLDRNPSGNGIHYDRVEDLPPGVRHPIEMQLKSRQCLTQPS